MSHIIRLSKVKQEESWVKISVQGVGFNSEERVDEVPRLMSQKDLLWDFRTPSIFTENVDKGISESLQIVTGPYIRWSLILWKRQYNPQ